MCNRDRMNDINEEIEISYLLYIRVTKYSVESKEIEDLAKYQHIIVHLIMR